MSVAGIVRRRFPAEWEPQSGVQLTWPHADGAWGAQLDEIEPIFAQIGAKIARREKLVSVCQTLAHQTSVRTQLLARGAPETSLLFTVAPSNDVWARDHGPLTVTIEGAARILDFRFNGWGGKFPAALDDQITAKMVGNGIFRSTPLERQHLVLEGGALETDGQGTLLATRHSVLAASRNPGLRQTQIEQVLTTSLGIERFLWLDHCVLTGDDTDGHIDTLARFCDPHTLVYTTCAPENPDFPELQRMHQELASLRQADDTPYRLIPLTSADLHQATGRRLPATYTNFLVINEAVLVPTYACASDSKALRTLGNCFPDREIIPIDCGTVIRQNGSLHCLAMQFPRELELADTNETKYGLP